VQHDLAGLQGPVPLNGPAPGSVMARTRDAPPLARSIRNATR
jgi:hypothetical protein